VNGAPNPFRNRLNLHFALPQAGRVTVQVFAADGRLVETLANGEMAAGEHALEWKTSGQVPSGVYFYKVFANGLESSGKIVRGVSDLAPSGTQFGDKAIEADNNDVAPFTQLVCSGRSNPTVANFTMIGDRSRVGGAFPGSTFGVNLRRATAGQVLNSIVTNFKTVGLQIDDDVTWLAHCPAIPAAPALFCSPATTGVPVGEGRVLVTNSAPNPFRSRLSLYFKLTQAGRVTAQVFSADGRLVATLANGEMAAGEHSLEWKTSGQVPSGVYFYRVFANGLESRGKVVRVD